MKILKAIFQRPVTIFFVIVLSIVFGVLSTTGMAINLLPDMAFPYLTVSTVYVGADAETVDKKVTLPLENSLKTVSDLRDISTYSLDSASIVIMQFQYGTDLDKKEKEVGDAIDGVSLPSDAKTPTIAHIDLNSSSVFTLAVYSDEKDMNSVYDAASELKDELSTISGVESATFTGAPNVGVRVDMINGLESFAPLIVQALAKDAGYDIPLGDMVTDDGGISVINRSAASSIEELKNLSIGVDLPATYQSAFRSAQEGIKHLEEMNVEDCESFHEDALDMRKAMDELDAKNVDELNELYDDVAFMKALINLIENYSAPSLSLLWSTTLKAIVEDPDFQSMSEEDLHKVADDANVSYDLLKWAQDNSATDPTTGKTYAEGKWNKIVDFRKAHPDEVKDEDYPALFYELEIHSSDPTSEDYKSEEDIVDEVRGARILSLSGLRNYIDKRENEEEITDSDYGALFIVGGDQGLTTLSPLVISFVRDSHFEANYEIFYHYKKNHVHEEEVVDEETGTSSTKMVGDPISSKDFMAMYDQMVFDQEPDLKPTERLLDFIRGVDFTSSKVIFDLKQACDVYLSTTYESIAYFNGKQAIQIDLYAASGANAASISRSAQSMIEAYNKKGLSVQAVMINNQANFISDSLSNALVSLLIGMFLAVIVIYLFLRKVKSSLIIAVSMPISVFLTLICLYLMGITLNMVSVGGIAVGIGMLVDNSIVVLESITSERSKGKKALEASVDGVKLVMGSLIGSTLTSICVFFPILFIRGLTREIFADLAWAVIFSLSFSLLVAIFIIPTLFCLFYGRKEGTSAEVQSEKKSPLFARFTNWYSRVLEKGLRHKGMVILSALGIFGLSFLLIFACKIEFMPSIDQGKIDVNISFRSDDKDKYCQDETHKAYQLIYDNVDNIESISMSSGNSGFLETGQQGQIAIQLGQNHKKTAEVVEEIRALLDQSSLARDFSIYEVDGVVASIVGGFSGVTVTVQGPDVEVLKEIAIKAKADVMKKEGVKAASDDMLDTSFSYTITFDKAKLVEKNLDYEALVSTLRVGLSGYDVSTLSEGNEDYSVTVGWGEEAIPYYGNLSDLIVGFDQEGNVIRLAEVANITLTEGRHIIRKTNGLNLLSISIETYGLDTNTATRYLTDSVNYVLRDYPGYTSASTGLSFYLSDAFEGLFIALIISFFLLYGVMACLFESLRKPFIIIFSFPFAFVGGFLALAISRVSINVVSFIGLIMLMGVIINDAIVLNERIDQLVESGMEKRKAVIEGCRQRLRAVLMTTLTTVLALIPMALGLGKGGALMQPLGVVAIGGMSLGTIVTLILIPSVYCWFYRIKFKKEEPIFLEEEHPIPEKESK